jgi:uncharacterized protein (UPF0548 family)
MFLFSHPRKAQIDAFLAERESDSFSYTEVGASRELVAPPGYVFDHNRQLLGNGDADFEKAKQAIRDWKMFEVPGIELFYTNTPIEVGRTVAMLASHLGFYSINSCRIVYTIDEPQLFGFAYGTLTEHVEMGEESFTVELDPDTGEVWYDLHAFSRPAHPFVKLGYPYGRYLQRQFARGSKESMRRAVEAGKEI